MEKRFREEREEITQYVEKVFSPEDTVLRDVRESTTTVGMPSIQIGKMDALHLEVIAAASGAKKAVEFGTLAGYSGIALLRGMGEGSFLQTMECDPKHAKVAAENFKKAGFAQSVKIWEGNALDNLPTISKEGPFDLVFIDADKENYENYFRWVTENTEKEAVVLADNCFAFGNIAATEFKDKTSEKIVESMQAFNSAVADHPDFRATMLPTGEGLLMAVRVA